MGSMDRILIVILLSLAFSEAADIYGNLYDPALKRMYSSVIEINTTPRQRFVSTNGSYHFTISPGSYEIRASSITGLAAMENLTVVDEGRYILDLFLYPEDGLDIGDVYIPEPIPSSKMPVWLLTGFGVLLVSSAFIIAFLIRQNTDMRRMHLEALKGLDDDEKKVLTLLRDNKGRLSQQVIGREFTYTDAKVSLMLTDLEDKRFIRRVKRGRANMIFLN